MLEAMNKLPAIALHVLCILPQPDTVLRDYADTVEVNHLFDEHGHEVFTQVIWLDVVSDEERVVAWRLVKQPTQLPIRDWQSGGYVCQWLDGECVREVRTNCVRESWTQYDPELAARDAYPKEKRRGLLNEGQKAKMSGRRSATSCIPKPVTLLRSNDMSDVQSTCAAPTEKSGTVEYRDVVGWPGYRVGSDGSVWTCKLTNHGPTEIWKRLEEKPSGKYGHLRVCLSKDGSDKRVFVHTIVLEAFVGPRPNGLIARHFPDRTPSNNAVSNLRWGTYIENFQDRDADGTTCKGERHPKAVLTAEKVLEMRLLAATGIGDQEIAKRFGINDSTVWAALVGVSWKHVGGPLVSRGRSKGPRRIA